jgi:hypothetical protein
VIETSTSVTALTAAIIRVQSGLSGVKKDAVNPHFKNRYATLENVIDTARPALQEAKIAFVQAPGLVVDGSVEVTTMLVHESGEWMRSTLHVPLQKRDAQGVGSAITYGCRYSLMAMLGLPPTDDDGEAATQPEPPAKRQVGWSKDGTTRTANSLKKDGAWEKLKSDLDADLLDCGSTHQLDKLREIYRTRARSEHWPNQWLFALSEVFEGCAADIKKMEEAEINA